MNPSVRKRQSKSWGWNGSSGDVPTCPHTHSFYFFIFLFFCSQFLHFHSYSTHINALTYGTYVQTFSTRAYTVAPSLHASTLHRYISRVSWEKTCVLETDYGRPRGSHGFRDLFIRERVTCEESYKRVSGFKLAALFGKPMRQLAYMHLLYVALFFIFHSLVSFNSISLFFFFTLININILFYCRFMN